MLPHKHRKLIYGIKQQYAHVEGSSPSLNEKGVQEVQSIVGVLLFYGRAVDNKLLVAINAIGSQQAHAIEETNKAVATLLDYVATYPEDGILYRASDMILAAHSGAGFHNESKGRIRTGAHIFLSDNDPIPRWNGAILTIALMSSPSDLKVRTLGH